MLLLLSMAAEAEGSNIAEAQTGKVAAIFGVTGLVGKELAGSLTAKHKWNKVYGVARKADQITPVKSSNFHFISCDLLNPLETKTKLSVLRDVTHVFWVTWATQFSLDSHECCQQNKAMMSNAIQALLPIAESLSHVSLQTGMKHYISLSPPFDQKDQTVFTEESPRAKGGRNFYYVLEDLLRESLACRNVSWTVHRPGLIMGSSIRTLYNFIGSLCVYGAICEHLNLPFVFGGTRECWEERYIDVSDARMVAEQHIWAATNGGAATVNGQAFNAIDGSSFTWKELWPALAVKLNAKVPDNMIPDNAFMFSIAMADKRKTWKEITVKKGLVQTEMEDLANWVFLDELFRCPVKLLGSRDKADKLGFTAKHNALDSVFYWIDVMRKENIVP